MVKLINLIVKILATVIVFFPIGGLLTILSIIFWDTRYIQVAVKKFFSQMLNRSNLVALCITFCK